jgi:hypothetical protein
MILEPLSLHPLGATDLQVSSLYVHCVMPGNITGTFAYSKERTSDART